MKGHAMTSSFKPCYVLVEDRFRNGSFDAWDEATLAALIAGPDWQCFVKRLVSQGIQRGVLNAPVRG
jgi:hypothetical protein